MNLNELRDEAYSIAKANGWHEEEHSDNHWLMLVITQIAEAVQADRKVHHARVDKFIGDMSDKDNAEDYWYRLTFAQNIENTVESELADIVIRCLDLAGLREINIDIPKLLSESNMAVTFCMSFTEFCHSLCCLLLALNVPLKGRIIQVLDRIFLYCKSKDIDLEFFIRTKMKYNRLRGYHHGGKRY